jgi:hypothetical protein
MMEAKYTILSITMRELLPFKHLVETVPNLVSLDMTDVTQFKMMVHEYNSGSLTLANMEPGQMTSRSMRSPKPNPESLPMHAKTVNKLTTIMSTSELLKVLLTIIHPKSVY